MANSDNTDKHRNKLVGALQLTEQSSGVCAIPSGMVGYWNDAGVVKLRNADGSDTVQASGSGVQILRAHAVCTSALAANTYANGTAGVGATLTGNANGAFATIDGVAAALNNIYLVAGEAAALGNGLYKLTTLGTGGTPYVLTRVEEFDSSGEMRDTTLFLIRGGTVNADTTWKYTGADSPTVGTTALTFERDTGVVTTNTAQTISALKTFGADILLSNGFVVGFGAPQALSGPGAVNVTSLVTLFTSTGGADALTLADGARAGQLKFIVHVVDGGSGVCTPTTATNFTTLTLTAVYDWGLMIWSGTAWRPVAFGGTAAFA